MIATIRQKLKAIDTNDYGINLKNLDIGPETDAQGNINPEITRYNEKVSDILANKDRKDLGSVTDAIKQAAIEMFNIKPSKGKRQDCDPEMAVLIEQLQQAINRNSEEEVKQITKDIKKMAALKRTKTQLNEFYEGNWTSVKEQEWDLFPHTPELLTREGKLSTIDLEQTHSPNTTRKYTGLEITMMKTLNKKSTKSLYTQHVMTLTQNKSLLKSLISLLSN